MFFAPPAALRLARKSGFSPRLHHVTNCDIVALSDVRNLIGPEWAAKMKSIGLVPSSTGAPGGKETGQKVSHYIAQGGPFAAACAELAGQGVAVSYVDLWGDEDEKTRRKKAASKTKYTCPSCGLNAWAKPEVVLVCGECEIALTEAFAASADETAPKVTRQPGRGPQPQ